MSPLATAALLAVVSLGSTTAIAQVVQGGTVVIDPGTPIARVGFSHLRLDLDPFTAPPATGVNRWAGVAMRQDRSLQAPTGTPAPGRSRSTTRIVFGAIAGGVGGFFAGGFLGAHIEGDRCNCDDPGVRGFLIGAPIGAVAGGIAGARFLF